MTNGRMANVAERRAVNQLVSFARSAARREEPPPVAIEPADQEILPAAPVATRKMLPSARCQCPIEVLAVRKDGGVHSIESRAPTRGHTVTHAHALYRERPLRTPHGVREDGGAPSQSTAL